MKRYLTHAADKARAKLKERLEANDSKLSLTLDLWTSSNRLNFMGISLISSISLIFLAITAHYIDESCILHEDLLDFTEITGRHKGKHLAKHDYNVLRQFNIHTKLMCIITDNASNNGKMCIELTKQLLENAFVR